ncbi:MAG: ABC transporter permease [Deltaproteobacteria bacterium]|nr:ABC transporter permease [Deltaproteobacteria bacterium]MBI3076291.1 ABC transporter permease [Deltaproteobacteria bacterium]
MRARLLAFRGLPQLLSLLLLVALLVASLAPGLFTAEDPYGIQPLQRLRPPGAAHPLGTDEMGRDLWARIVYGARITLASSVSLIVLAVVVGGIVGLVAGSASRRVDEIIMRTTDLFLAFPRLILALAVASALGRGMVNAVLAFALVWWAQYARIMRSQVLVVREREFVVAARALGCRRLSLIFRHLLPNCVTPVLVRATLDLGLAILLLSSLSFLGLGVQPPTPDWGAMIATGRKYLLGYWWYPTFPGVAIFATVLAFNLVGERVKDVLDPRQGPAS